MNEQSNEQSNEREWNKLNVSEKSGIVLKKLLREIINESDKETIENAKKLGLTRINNR